MSGALWSVGEADGTTSVIFGPVENTPDSAAELAAWVVQHLGVAPVALQQGTARVAWLVETEVREGSVRVSLRQAEDTRPPKDDEEGC